MCVSEGVLVSVREGEECNSMPFRESVSVSVYIVCASESVSTRECVLVIVSVREGGECNSVLVSVCE